MENRIIYSVHLMYSSPLLTHSHWAIFLKTFIKIGVFNDIKVFQHICMVNVTIIFVNNTFFFLNLLKLYINSTSIVLNMIVGERLCNGASCNLRT